MKMLPDFPMLLIVAIAWIYVVLMMSITEHSVIAGIMTFLLYCVLPLTIILYLLSTPQRRRRRNAKATVAAAVASTSAMPDDSDQSIIAPATSSTTVPAAPADALQADRQAPG